MSTSTRGPRDSTPAPPLAAIAPAMLVLATAIVLLWAVPAIVRQVSHEQTVHQVREASLRLTESATAPSSQSILDQFNQASRDVATFVRPSVVHISAQHDMGSRPRFAGISTGSGWIWDTKGHVLTNWHVIAGAKRIDVQLHDGTVRTAHLVGQDPTTDIAVIQVPGERLIPASRADASEEIHQGSLVFAFGSPLDFRFSMSQGIVSGMGRSVGLFRSARSMGYENFIQVDAAINPGNSGGPLTNHRGEVIGMNTAIATNDSESEGRFSGIGLAIPLDMIESVATQVIDGGVVRKGYLGITVLDQQALVYQWLLPLGLDINLAGVFVSHVSEGNLLSEAGLNRGDVITHYDGQLVSTPEAFWAAISADPDDQAVLSVWRAIPDRDAAQSLTLRCDRPADRVKMDVRVLSVIDDISSYYNDIGFDRTGILVVKTMPGKPARRNGLQAGDIITTVNGREMRTVDQLRSTISSMLPDSVVKIAVWRPGQAADTGDQLNVTIPLTELDE